MIHEYVIGVDLVGQPIVVKHYIPVKKYFYGKAKKRK